MYPPKVYPPKSSICFPLGFPIFSPSILGVFPLQTAPLVAPQLEAFSRQLHGLQCDKLRGVDVETPRNPPVSRCRTRPVTQRKIILAPQNGCDHPGNLEKLLEKTTEGYKRYNKEWSNYCKGIQNTHTLPDHMLWPPPMLMDVSHVQVLNLLVCQSAIRPQYKSQCAYIKSGYP